MGKCVIFCAGEFDALLEKLIEDSALKDGTPDKMYNTQYHERWQIRW